MKNLARTWLAMGSMITFSLVACKTRSSEKSSGDLAGRTQLEGEPGKLMTQYQCYGQVKGFKERFPVERAPSTPPGADVLPEPRCNIYYGYVRAFADGTLTCPSFTKPKTKSENDRDNFYPTYEVMESVCELWKTQGHTKPCTIKCNHYYPPSTQFE